VTELLSRAFERASELHPTLQDELARQILEDLVGESKWEETLARTQDQLEKLADQALAELRAGRTTQMGFDEL
jgi:hypothetical protein